MISKILLLIHILIYLNLSVSFAQQNDASIEESLLLTETNADSIISIDMPPFHIYSFIDVKGLGRVVLSSVRYVFYNNAGVFYSKQLVDYCDGDCEDIKLGISNAIKLENQNLFEFVGQNFAELNNERILPFVYKGVDVGSKITMYQQLYVSHPDEIKIFIYLSGKKIYGSVNADDCEATAGPDKVRNLNYAYNNQTKLKALRDLVEKLISRLQDQYEY